MPNQKLDKLKNLLALVDESVSRTDFEKNFEILLQYVVKIGKKNEEEMGKMGQTIASALSDVEEKQGKDFTTLKSELSAIVKSQVENMYSDWSRMSDQIQTRIAELKDGEDADEERVAEIVMAKMPKTELPPKETPEEIRDSLEALTGDERLDKSAVKGIDEALAKIAEGGKAVFVSGTAKPIRILNNGTVVDKNVRHINFKGTAVTSVVRKTDGTVDVTLTAGAGGEIAVYNEVVAGSGTSFILANTPTSGTVRLFGYGQRLTPGAGNDYTISGTTITLINSFDTGSILADYSY